VADLWYYQQNGEARGPLPLSHLQALLKAGEIEVTTLVWQQDLPGWIELSSLQRQQTGSIAEPPPAPPPLPQPLRKPTPARARAGSQTPLYAALLVVAILAAALLGYVGRGLMEKPNSQISAIKPPQEKKTKLAARPREESTTPPAMPSVVVPSLQQPPAPVEPDPAADVVTAPLPTVVPAVDTVPVEPATTPPARPADATNSNSPSETRPVKPSAVSNHPIVLFQELDIQRMPKLGMLGTMTVQDLRYQILSRIKISAPNEEGVFTCEQEVLETRLVKADDLSRGMFLESLTALKGWQFSYQLNNRRVITEWKSGPPDGRKVAEVKPPGAAGFLATSVMDEDGWKELAQLTFFVPRPEQGSKSWKQPMMHNFGPLGSWYGETTFTPQATREGIEQIGFVHKMEYRPPEKDAGGGLPFTIEKAMLKPEKAAGAIEFDTQAKRVVSAQEAFLVRGALSVSLLGQSTDVEVEEQQVISLRLHERNPWQK
jgi:hypothetical protein